MGQAALVELVRAPNPGPLTGSGTNTWIYGRGDSVVIDPGPADESHLATVVEAATRRGRIIAVAVTHHHADHIEGAARICELTGAPLAVHFSRAHEARTLPLHDGDRLLVGASELTALHTPGHASDHLCFFDESVRILFTGDHVLQGTTSLIMPPDGDMTAYLQSLDRVLRLGPTSLHPGHGELIADGETSIRELIAHRLERESQILHQLRLGPAGAEALVSQLYASYPIEVRGMAAGTVMAHLLKLERDGRVRQLDQEGPAQFRLVQSS